MSISDKLVYLSGTKDAIRDAIEQKGVAVPEETTFREYADKISQISGGGGGGAPVPTLAEMDKWDSPIINSSSAFNMSYSDAEVGDTVYTVLMYYAIQDPELTVSPSGIVEELVETRDTEVVVGDNELVIKIFKHIKDAEDPTVTFDVKGSGRRQLGYFTIKAPAGYICEESVISTTHATVVEDGVITIPAQSNVSDKPVFRFLALSWVRASTSDNPNRWLNVPPAGWAGINFAFPPETGTSYQNRLFTMGIHMNPGDQVGNLSLESTSALTNNDFILCISLDIYFVPE